MVPFLVSKCFETAVTYEIIIIHCDLIPLPLRREEKLQKISRNGNEALNICYKICNSISLTRKLNSELSRFHMTVVEMYCNNVVPFEQL